MEEALAYLAFWMFVLSCGLGSAWGIISAINWLTGGG